MPIENNSNYNPPLTVAGPTTFKGSYTAKTAAEAEARAIDQAYREANAKYGVGTTQAVGVPEIRIKLNNDKPQTYTATYTFQATQISPAKTPDPVPVETPPPVVEDDPPPDPDPVLDPPVVEDDPPPEPTPVPVVLRPPAVPPNDYPPLPVTPGPLPDWYVKPPVTEPVPEPPAVEAVPEPQQVIPNPNGDPNPNAIITPPSPDQPSNLQIANVNVTGLQGQKNETLAAPTIQDTKNARTEDDWRVRLSLAPDSKAKYLYNAPNAGILEPLQATDGVIFPYLPQIQVTYAANYETADIVHTNYKMIQYKNSAVDQVTITGDFTAQDSIEANYLLAVIHFFKSVTKMFYGKDQIPKPGTPPPLCYLSGLGEFQFNEHPLVISSFNYSLPNDVDYIRVSSPTLLPGVDSSAYNPKGGNQSSGDIRRGVLNAGATASPVKFRNYKATNTHPTYVPTKMSITITAYPIVTRNDISNNFSVRDYATGALLQGSNRRTGGIW